MPAVKPWSERHVAKWERIAGTIPGLQFVTVDDTHFEIRVSLPHLEEVLVVGRPRINQIIAPTDKEIIRAAETKRPTPQARVVVHPEVDLSDDDIDRVLEHWRRGESAAAVAPTLNLMHADPKPSGGGYPAM